jgi:hypothetical protein
VRQLFLIAERYMEKFNVSYINATIFVFI